MKKFILAVSLSIMLVSCNSEPTLQKYFVDNSESKEFIAVDLSTGILKIKENTLDPEEKKALDTFKNINVLAFKADEKNQAKFETERAKVENILKDEKYQELMKVSSGKEGGAVYFVGDDNAIDEFVLYGNKKENGFALVRVLGNDMSPNSIMTMMNLLQKADLNMDQLKPLEALLKK